MDKHTTAIHEAAHFVVACRFDHNVGPVSIRRYDARGRPLILHEKLCDWSIDEEMATVLFASGAAVAAFCGTNEGIWHDEDDARDLLQDQDLPAGTEARLRADAAQLVRQEERTIRALAAALEQEYDLDAEEATIIVAAVDDGEDWRRMLDKLRAHRRAATLAN
jgi:hypothetical protein